MMRRLSVRVVPAFLGLLLTPVLASAQATSAAASIAGVVRDTSGGVLPGVTVEAIHEATATVRVTVSDSEGLYRILELRPGVYTVTFTLPGFSVLRREGLELPPNFTATINAELRVGALEETITVSGQTPLVDVQNVTAQRVIPSSLLSAVPSAKSMLSIAALMPAVVTPPNAQDVGGSKGEQSVRISVHGGRTTDQRLLQDGMSYNSLAVEGTGRGYYMNPLANQEVVIDVGSLGSAQYSLGGAMVNAIPRDGGNRLEGTWFTSYMDESMQSSNLTQRLKDRGLEFVNGVVRMYDLNGVLSGPIVRNRLFFMTAHRRSGGATRVANTFRDADITDWFFTPDLSRPLEPEELLRSHNFRLTAQPSSKDRMSFTYDFQRNVRDQLTGQLDRGTTALEANSSYCNLNDLFQGSWTRPHTNRLLFEAGVTVNRFGFGANWGSDILLRDYKACGHALTDRVSINDTGLGFTYHGVGNRGKSQSNQSNGRFNVSYVTGSHTIKTGIYYMASIRHQSYSERDPVDVGGLPLSYVFRFGVPQSLTQFIDRTLTDTFLRPDLGLFIQDQWTRNRLTINVGLRYDYMRQYSGPTDRPATALADAAFFPGRDNTPRWHDLNPRMAVVYDLFGDGRSAIKAGMSRYITAATVGIASDFRPSSAAVTSTSRSWTDTNGNFFPDCDLRNKDANGECGRMNNQNFGGTTVVNNPDPEWITGWGKRTYNWQSSISFDQQITDGLAVNVGYFRTWFGNQTVTDNLLVGPEDYDTYCVMAPVDPRLPPEISGAELCGFADIKPEKFGLVDNIVTLAKNYGQETEIYNGVDVNFAMRLPRGIQVQGGWNVGNAIQTGVVAGGDTSSSTDRCYVVDSPEQLRHCKVDNPYQHRFKLSGAIPLPWDLQTAVVFQTVPSINYGATLSYTNAQIAPSLGRNLSSGNSRTIQLLPPFSAFVQERINQVDVRASKIFRLPHGMRLQANFDVYNLLNGDTIVAVNNTFGERWLEPQQVLEARLMKISFQFDF